MSQNDATLIIPSRFCGPHTSGNGGYVSGLLAERLAGPVEVTLRRPPPLDRELRVEVLDGEARYARLLDGDALIAEARCTTLELDVPPAPTLTIAERWSKGYAGFLNHAFPRCFTCGPDRIEGDGLRIFPGHSPDESMVAARFSPGAAFADAKGAVPVPVVWAALDCPGYFAAAHPDFALLGRMTAELLLPLRAAEDYVVMGWKLGREGRKVFAATAILDNQSVVYGKARQTWVVAG